MARARLVLLLALTASCSRPEADEVLPKGEVGGAASSFEWRTRQIIDNPNPGVGDEFGYAVAVNDRFIVVGASSDDEGAFNGAGSVYVFDANNGTLLIRIPAPSAAAGDSFGAGVGFARGPVGDRRDLRGRSSWR